MKTRNTARLIILNEKEETLLIRFKLSAEAPRFWATVGGEIEPGESFSEALRRELKEETGIADARVSSLAYFGTHMVPWNGEQREFFERFAVCWVKSPAISLAEITSDEKEVVKGYKWWRLAELKRSKETYFPKCLPELIAEILRDGAPQEPREITL